MSYIIGSLIAVGGGICLAGLYVANNPEKVLDKFVRIKRQVQHFIENSDGTEETVESVYHLDCYKVNDNIVDTLDNVKMNDIVEINYTFSGTKYYMRYRVRHTVIYFPPYEYDDLLSFANTGVSTDDNMYAGPKGNFYTDILDVYPEDLGIEDLECTTLFGTMYHFKTGEKILIENEELF